MRRKAGGQDQGAGTLEIEFEDDEGAPEPAVSPAGRPRDLRPAALIALVVAVLGAALLATHRTGPSDTQSTNELIPMHAVPNYAAFVVTVEYRDSRLLSLAQRRIEVDLRFTPVPGARVRILNYYVNENGVYSEAEPAPSATPLPASGADVKLDLTVADCAAVPIGESMGSVDVVADGPAGVMDRFTILGERYSAELAQLLRAVCPDRHGA